MKFSLWTKHGALNSKPVFDAFRKGCASLGIHTEDNSVTSDVDVIWSMLWAGRMSTNRHIWKRNQRSGKPTIVLEVGGISRGSTWKMGLNGVNRLGFDQEQIEDDTRAKQMGLELKPWNFSGNRILVCGQHEKSEQWKNMPPMSAWIQRTIEQLQVVTRLPIVFRPHPRCPVSHIERRFSNVTQQQPQKISNSYDDFDLAFDDIRATVSWNSNPGIHSVIQGIPAYTGPDSLAYDVSIKNLADIETTSLPDRQQWLNNYAWTEFTLEEISSGFPIKRLTNRL